MVLTLLFNLKYFKLLYIFLRLYLVLKSPILVKNFNILMIFTLLACFIYQYYICINLFLFIRLIN